MSDFPVLRGSALEQQQLVGAPPVTPLQQVTPFTQGDALTQDPRFKKLSYQGQIVTRQKLMMNALAKDSRFASLSPQARQQTAEILLQREAKKAPALWSYSGELTDADRAAFDDGTLSADPNAAYKSALIMGERFMQGVQDPHLVDQAKSWTILNRVGTESLLAKIAFGAKDAIEVMFGTDDKFGNDLRLNTQDYQRLSTWLVQQMPEKTRGAVSAEADVVGGAAAFIETVGLNATLIGNLKAPGLFTRKLWSGIEALGAAATTPTGVAMANVVLPNVISALGSGTIDTLRRLPELIQDGKIYGPKKFTEGLAGTFGQGVLWDFVFNTAKDIYKYALKPIYRTFKGVNLTDPKTVQPFLDASKNFDPDTFADYLNQTFSGKVPKELYDQLDDAGKKGITDLANFMKTNAAVPDFDVQSPQGFKTFAKAVGFDADMVPEGIIIKGGDDFADKLFKNPSEAVSWMIQQGYEENAVNDIASASVGRLRTSMRTGLKLKDLNDAQLTSLMDPNFRGGIPESNLKGTALEILDRYGAKKPSAVEFVDEAQWSPQASVSVYEASGRKLLLPKTLTGTVTKDQVLTYLANISGNPGDTRFAVSAGVQTLSGSSLQAAVARIPGAELKQAGRNWILSYNGQTQSFSELTQVNELVTKMLYSTGVLSEDEIARQVAESTGYVLTKDKDPLGVVAQRWVLRDQASGREIAQDDDLSKLLFGKMNFSPKLPETLAPDIVVEPNGKLTIRKTVAYGPVSSLRQMMDDYGPAESFYSAKEKKELIKGFADGSKITYQAKTAHYELEVPSMGIRQAFPSAKKAQEYFDQIGNNYGVVRQLAERRGYKIVGLPDGSVGFYNGSDMLRARTAAEAQQILRSSPDPEASMNLFPFLDQETENSIKANTQNALSETTEPLADRSKSALKLYQSTIKSDVGTLMRPALSSFEEMATLYNDPSITEHARQFMLRRRFVGQQTYEAARTVERMLSPGGKMFKDDELELMGKLLQYDESNWAKGAKILMANDSYILKPEMEQALRQSRAYLNHLGSYFGIDPLRFMNQYSPHIRKILDDNGGLAQMLTKSSREQVMEQLFGKSWANIPEVKFLSQNSRLDAFLDANSQPNLLNTLIWYTEHGLREKFLGSYIGELKGWLTKLKNDGANPVLLGRLAGFYSAATGGDSDFLGSVITDSSIRASQAISGSLQKLAGTIGPTTRLGKKISELADATVTTNYLDKVSGAISGATLGWRPFRAISNLAQYMNTYSVYAQYSEDAIAWVDKHAEEYIPNLFAKGILNERVFAATPEGYKSTVGTFLDKGMKWNQNAEYLTRAWTAKAVELAFDEANEKLSKGLLGTGNTAFKKFLKLSKLDLLDDTDQSKILEYLKIGKPEAAKDLAQSSMVRIFMFDYAKENYPMLFKGTMGKLFGRFGVYPVGQIDLYRRIASRSDYGTRIIRGMRLMGSSLAIYEAFRQLGIDYSGFLFTDPFSFSGGPLYQAAQDLLKVNAEGVEGSMARLRLSKNFLPVAGSSLSNLRPNIPRLLTPGALEIQSLGKMITSIGQGQYFEGILDGMSAPRDLNYLGPGRLYFD